MQFNHCQVCGKIISATSKNCITHLWVREKTVLLAQHINSLNEHVSSDIIKELAQEYKVAENTVRLHLKRAGFEPVRGWKNKP